MRQESQRKVTSQEPRRRRRICNLPPSALPSPSPLPRVILPSHSSLFLSWKDLPVELGVPGCFKSDDQAVTSPYPYGLCVPVIDLGILFPHFAIIHARMR